VAGTSHSSHRPFLYALIAWTAILFFCVPAFAQTEDVSALPDSSFLLDTLAVDSLTLMALMLPAEDTSWVRFVPPGRWRSVGRYQLEDLLAGPSWPMPPPEVIAGGDLADWLSYHPAYDVDDAPGVGQTRFYTRWGLVDRSGDWQVDGRPVSWQRLTFPMTPQFDPAILPSFSFDTPRVGDKVILRRDTAWGERPVFDYTFRQGDFSDSYSEGYFRARTKKGFGLDLSGVFFSSDGRYASDNRDKRIVSLETFGPVRKNLYWRTRYEQFRDKTRILTPEPFDLLRPRRNDLLWSGEVALAEIIDSTPLWQVGARIESGDQRLTDPAYAVASDDRDWQLFGESQIAGWAVDLRAGIEELDVDSTSAERWYAIAGASRMWRLNDAWSAALRISASDWDSDPPSLSATAVLSPRWHGGLRPSLRFSSERVVPTLFDRRRPLAEYSLIDASQTGFIYSEAGDPSLEDQWENSVSVQWGADTFSDSAAFDWTIGGHAAYVENYTVWEGREETDTLLGNPIRHYRYRPRPQDARSLGAAFGAQGRLIWKIHYLTHYAVKYATDLDDRKLSGYYPHKGVAMLSLIAPKWKYGVDLRLNAAGLWWYGDTRIDPTGYATSHAFRLDLSGSARIVGDLTIYALMQNIANFPYRTGAGYPFTGRTVRFGLHVTLFD
jgi:hypothetical protein